MRIAWTLIVLAACGDDGGGGASVDAARGDTSGSGGAGWTTGTAVAQGAIQETAAVGVAGKIYLIGGFDDNEGIVARVQVYDTATNAWSDGPALPRAVHHANAVTDGTTIYVLGALTGNNFTAIGDSYKLDPATATQWTTLAAMPTGRERGAAVTGIIANKIYVAGGFRALAASDLTDVYDPAADTWTALGALPATRDHACGAAVGDELIFSGGRTVQTNSPRPDVYSYSPSLGMWKVRPSMPTGRGGMGCGAIGNKLYTTGGEGNAAVASGVFPDVEVFDPATDTWTELPNMPNPKHGVAGAVWDGALYLCGGADKEGFGAIAATDIFRP
jgi:N-acetylneuraminic acid mutarotase